MRGRFRCIAATLFCCLNISSAFAVAIPLQEPVKQQEQNTTATPGEHKGNAKRGVIVCDPETFQNCHEESRAKPPRLIHADDLVVVSSASAERGIAKVMLIVDEKGLPQKVTLVQPFLFGNRPASVAAEMNQNAISAVKTYRFKPATLEKLPVTAAITVEVVLH
jgi:hypothetical protein